MASDPSYMSLEPKTVSLEATPQASNPPPSPDPIKSYYQTLTSTADKDSDLGGATITKRADKRRSWQSNGSLNHQSGVLTLRDGIGDFVSTGKPDAEGNYRDASGDESVNSKPKNADGDPVFAASYAYVMAIDIERPVGDDPVTDHGVVGILTASNHIPASGNATWTGEAESTAYTIYRIYNSTDKVDRKVEQTTALGSGKSTVTADFGEKSVNVELTGFEQSASAPFDTVRVTNMRISGNRFSNGNILAYKNGEEVRGWNYHSQHAKGAFYGHDNDNPDEVAGVVGAESTGLAVTDTEKTDLSQDGVTSGEDTVKDSVQGFTARFIAD